MIFLSEFLMHAVVSLFRLIQIGVLALETYYLTLAICVHVGLMIFIYRPETGEENKQKCYFR